MRYIFGICLTLLTSIGLASAQDGVTLTAEILDKSLRDDAQHMIVELKVRLTIRNNMDRPAILIVEDDNSVCDTMGIGLFTQADPQAHMYGPRGRPLYSDGAPPSFPGEEYVAKMRRELEVEPPPSSLTRILAKDETIIFTETRQLYVRKTADRSSVNESWSTFLSFSPLDMYLSCHTFSTHLDRGHEEGEFVRALKARWERFGDLWLDGFKTGRITLDLRSLKTKSSR